MPKHRTIPQQSSPRPSGRVLRPSPRVPAGRGILLQHQHLSHQATTEVSRMTLEGYALLSTTWEGYALRSCMRMLQEYVRHSFAATGLGSPRLRHPSTHNFIISNTLSPSKARTTLHLRHLLIAMSVSRDMVLVSPMTARYRRNLRAMSPGMAHISRTTPGYRKT